MLGKAKSFRLSLKGGRGAVVTFRKSNKRGGLFFSGKAWKERFSFREKHIRDGFNVTFSLVRKSNQKRHFYVLFASAKRTKKQPRGLRPSRLPGSGSKFRAVDYLLNRKLCIYQKTSTKICNLVPYRSEYFEPVRDGGFTA